MRLFLFLDDYLLDAKRDVVRVFPAADLEKTFPHYASRSGYTHYNVATKRFEAWDGPEDDPYLVESLDGENWTETRKPGTLTVIGDPPSGCTVTQKTVPCPPIWDRWHGLEFHDTWDEDPARRYKAFCSVSVRASASVHQRSPRSICLSVSCGGEATSLAAAAASGASRPLARCARPSSQSFLS